MGTGRVHIASPTSLDSRILVFNSHGVGIIDADDVGRLLSNGMSGERLGTVTATSVVTWCSKHGRLSVSPSEHAGVLALRYISVPSHRSDSSGPVRSAPALPMFASSELEKPEEALNLSAGKSDTRQTDNALSRPTSLGGWTFQWLTA